MQDPNKPAYLRNDKNEFLNYTGAALAQELCMPSMCTSALVCTALKHDQAMLTCELP